MNNQPSTKSSLIGGAFLLYAVSILVGSFVLINYQPHKSDAQTNTISDKSSTPNFSEITNVTEKKSAFFQYLLPSINKKNDSIIYDRQFVINYQKDTQSRSKSDSTKIEYLQEKYKTTDLNELLIRIDQIPASLALAQAATESGWGSSRFAREGNNFFGQWCYNQGCGLVPLNRNQGATHEVKAFASVDDSISAYFDNLNTNLAYAEFRSIRSNLREKNESITGKKLSEGLIHYSEKGYEYVEMIRAMIASNRLEIYDLQLASNE